MVTVLSVQNFAFTDLKELISALLEVKQTMGLTSFAEVQRAQSDRGRAVTKAPRLEVMSFTMGIFILVRISMHTKTLDWVFIEIIS